MRVRDIVQRYLDANRLQLTGGSIDCISPVFPYFVMDAGYQYFCKYVKPLALSREAKRARSRWCKAYLDFNRHFTSAYSVDEQCEVSDLMDEFEAAIANDLMITQVAAMKCFEKEFSLEDQQVLSAVFMTNSLACDAQNIWAELHHGFQNKDINGALEWSRDMSMWYMKGFGNIQCTLTEGQVEYLRKCKDILSVKIVNWLKAKNEKED